jgi:hypothetical protein
MPLIGLAAGAPLGHAIGCAADYVAIGVLLAFGRYTLLASEPDDEQRLGQLTQMRGFGALREGAGRVAGAALTGLAIVLLAEKLAA